MADPFGLGLDLAAGADIQLVPLLTNLLIGAVLATVLAWHYRRYGRTFGNRTVMAQVFVLMTLVTLFAMTIVRVSLILTLGLLGALSIVRFRGPIKEPEELGYLFFSVGIGLGLGAGAVVPTILAFAVILAVLSIRSVYGARPSAENFYLTVDLPAPDPGPRRPEGALESIKSLVSENSDSADIRRVDTKAGALHATFRVDCRDKDDMLRLVGLITRKHRDASVTFVEQRGSVGA